MKNVIFLFLIAFSSQVYSQCQPTFTATPGPGGTVVFNLTSTSNSTILSTEWLYGDGTIDANLSLNPTHTYQYSYNNYEVCVSIIDTVVGCWLDSSCIRVNVTNAALNIDCPGAAAFTTTQSGTATVFSNTGGSTSWAIIDYGFGPISWPYPSSGNILYQYPLAGTYNVSSVSYLMMANGYKFPCDTFTTSIVVPYVGCNLGITIPMDTSGLNYFGGATLYSVGYTNYTWYIDNTVVSTSSSFQTPNNYPEGTYIVSLVATGPGGCYDSIAQVVDFYYTLQCPGITFTETKLPACDDYQFDAIGMTGSNTVEWYLDNVLQSVSPSVILNFPFPLGTNKGGYSVTGVVYGPNCITSNNYSYYNPAGYYYYLDTLGSINTWYVHTNISGSQIASELWDFGDGFTSTLSAPSHVYASAGFYNLCHTVTLVNGCTYDYCYNNYFFRNTTALNPIQVIVVPNITGVNEVEETNFKLFPNPTTGMINIESNLSNIQTALVYNLQGQVICRKEYSDVISVSELTSGIYILELLNQQNQSVVRKLFVRE